MHTRTASVSNLVVLVSAFCVLCSASFPVLATEKGWYFGFLVGESSIVDTSEFSSFCDTAFVACGGDETDTAFQGIAGYQVNNYFGVEGAYFDLGSPAVSITSPVGARADASMSGGTISLLPQFPIGSIGAIYGRLGAAVGDIKINAVSPELGRTESDSTTGGTITYGVGGAINLGRNVTVRVEWTRYAFDETLRLAEVDIVTPDIDVIGAALIFRFPKE